MTAKKLHRFEGRDVIATKIAITNAGDGLSKALAIDPEELLIGDTVFVVLECTVGNISFTQVKDTDSLVRVQKLKAGPATIVDRDLVAAQLAEQATRIEEAAGVHRLDFADATGAPDESPAQ